MVPDDDELTDESPEKIRTWQKHHLTQEKANLLGRGNFYRVAALVTGTMDTVGVSDDAEEVVEYDEESFVLHTIQPNQNDAQQRFEIVAAQHDFTIESEISVEELTPQEIQSVMDSIF